MHKTVFDCDESYHEILLLINDIPVHQKHLEFLVTVIYKSI